MTMYGPTYLLCYNQRWKICPFLVKYQQKIGILGGTNMKNGEERWLGGKSPIFSIFHNFLWIFIAEILATHISAP